MSVFGSTSRFKLTELVVHNGNIMPGLMKRFEFLSTDRPNSDTLRILIQGSLAGRPDAISNRLYGTTKYKWVLLLANNVKNPFDGWPKVGATIIAPTNPAIWREL